MKKIDWESVQRFYDSGNFWRDIMKEFGISNGAIAKAKKRGDLVLRSKSKSMQISLKNNPRKHTEEAKLKISKARIKYLTEHPDQVPYLLNHYSKGASYPEKYFNRVLVKSGLNYERYLQVGIYNLDFAFAEQMINLEIDGNQHYDDDKIVKSNIRRDDWLKENGWKIIRVRWSTYQKLSREGKRVFFKNMLQSISDESIKYENPEIVLLASGMYQLKKRYYCGCGNEIVRGANQCIKCSHHSQRKVINRPAVVQLKDDIGTLGYLGTGRKYGVSDSTIRKWLK